MPPKVKIPKESIVNAAIALLKRQGDGSINARTIASELGCSTQPIFSNFSSIDELKDAVLIECDRICQEYIANEINSNKYPAYKASGMAYIRFAMEEKELFKFLYMRDRGNENYSCDSKLNDDMVELVHKNTGLDGDDKKLFHLEMWAFVHGIASMMATGFFMPDWETVSKILSDAYHGLKNSHEKDQ